MIYAVLIDTDTYGRPPAPQRIHDPLLINEGCHYFAYALIAYVRAFLIL